jgi:hypothetical protein
MAHDGQSNFVVRFGTHDATTVITNSSFTVDITERTAMTRGATGFAVDAVGFPNVFPNIRPHRVRPSDKFTLQIQPNGTAPAWLQATFDIPAGYWSDSELTAYIKVQMALVPELIAIGPTTITWTPPVAGNGNADKWTLTVTTVGDPLLVIRVDNDQELSGAARLLGFTQLAPAFAASQTASSLPSLAGVNVVYVHSNDLAGEGCDGDGSVVRQIAAIPMTVAYGEWQAFGPDQSGSEVVSWSGTSDYRKPVTSIHLVLRDMWGEPLDIGDNSELFVSLRFFRNSRGQRRRG